MCQNQVNCIWRKCKFQFLSRHLCVFLAKIMKSVKQRCPVDGTSGSFLFVRAILLVFGAGDLEKCQTGVQ